MTYARSRNSFQRFKSPQNVFLSRWHSQSQEIFEIIINKQNLHKSFQNFCSVDESLEDKESKKALVNNIYVKVSKNVSNTCCHVIYRILERWKRPISWVFLSRMGPYFCNNLMLIHKVCNYYFTCTITIIFDE